MAQAGRIATIAGLGIAAAGALFTGIQSWPVITGSNNSVPAASQQFDQKSGTTNCANVQGGSGTVDCRTVTMTPPERAIRRLEFTLERGNERRFIDLVDANADKIVNIKFMISRDFGLSFDDDPNIGRRMILFVPAYYYDKSLESSDTSGNEFVFNVKDGGNFYQCLGVYYCADGYFSIQPVMGSMAGGVIGTGIMGMSDTQARLSDPSTR
jgi:hypothetical protein